MTVEGEKDGHPLQHHALAFERLNELKSFTSDESMTEEVTVEDGV